MNLPFWKLQSIGNDFPLFHLADIVAHADGKDLEEALRDLAIRASDRHFGIGGDGLLTLAQDGAELHLRMFNPDGTEDFCGNGLRCAALHAHTIGWGPGDSFTIKHLGREVPVTIEGDKIRSTIGKADYEPDKVPHKGGELFNETVWSGMDSGMPLSLFGSALTTGSTHVVIPTYAIPDDDTFKSVSAKIEVDPLYPQRTSVIWSQELEPTKIKIRIWERGVGETLGCGTGSSAAAADYLRRKGKGGTVEVQNPGGTVWVSMDAWSAPITIEGTAQSVYEGTASRLFA